MLHVPELHVSCNEPVDDTVVVLLHPSEQTVPLAELPLTQVFKTWPKPSVGVVHCVGMQEPITDQVPREHEATGFGPPCQSVLQVYVVQLVPEAVEAGQPEFAVLAIVGAAPVGQELGPQVPVMVDQTLLVQVVDKLPLAV